MTSSLSPTGRGLGEYWTAETERLVAMCEPKVDEYGSRDLIELGYDVARLADRPRPDEALAFELGVFFYVRGKMSRWLNAAERGLPVSHDTLDDIVTYVMMVKHDRTRIRTLNVASATFGSLTPES